MINILPTHTTSFRVFGWVQDPSNFRSLCDVVAIFDEKSKKHRALREEIIPRLVEERDGKGKLLEALDVRPLKISYIDLVGTSFTPRSVSRCNGIVQAAVVGQVREFIGDWPADNYVRWAHAFGFIKYNYSHDNFEITETGLQLSLAKTTDACLNDNEKELLTTAILAYPPAVRILQLLNKNEGIHLTKFDIGKQLGFVGEDGFTSLPQSVLIRELATMENAKEKNKMKADWDGSSDKYARMTAKWLEKLGLVIQKPKKITVHMADDVYTETIGQAYIISASGVSALNRTLGKSRHKRIAKNVCFEMLATKGSDREYLRTRRTYILKIISEKKRKITYDEIKIDLEKVTFNETIETIKADLKGLVNIGLNIQIHDNSCVWSDEINDFTLPLTQNLAKSSLTEIKEQIRPYLTHLSHEYLSLIDLAYDSKQNRLFEMKTLELFVDECEYHGLHLGGSRKPDGIIYTRKQAQNYGVIIDTKAYSKGYSLPISQADEMERYIRENQTRDLEINPNGWWNNFDNSVVKYYFVFISGHFVGNCKSQVERISKSTHTNGTSLDIKNLLLCANLYKSGEQTHSSIEKKIEQGYEFVCELNNVY